MTRIPLFATVLLALAACTGAEEITFAERASTACEQIQRRLNAIPEPTTPAEIDLWLQRTTEENREGTERIRDLARAATDTTSASALVRASEEATEAFEDWVHARRAEDPRGERLAQRRIDRARERFTAAARALGADACIPPAPASS